jgi:hypothetical protein
VGSAVLNSNHMDALAELATQVLTHPAIELDMITGRASQTGGETNNIALSEARAIAAQDVLVGFGVYPPPSVVALGSSEPIQDIPGLEIEVNRSVEIHMWFDFARYYSSIRDGSDPTGAGAIDLTVLQDAWNRGFANLTDAELDRAWDEIRLNSLTEFNETRFHDYFVITIINLSLELGRRAGGTLAEKVETAHVRVQGQLREAVGRPDRTLIIYRDAERFTEIAGATLRSGLAGASQALVQLGYDPLKKGAWALFNKTGSTWALEKLATTTDADGVVTPEDFPSKPGGVTWNVKGVEYARVNRSKSDPPSLALPDGVFELVESELVDN